jgi:hypothetical protein
MSLDPEATLDHEERNLRPGKIFRINVAVLLREVMSEDSFYWLYNASFPPVSHSPPGPDSIEAPLLYDLRMPTVKPVGSLYSTDDAALG